MSIRSYKQITPSIDSSVYVDDSAVLVGDIEIGEQSSIWPLVATHYW
jgi:carbonic anhydrase/acetyltransferase-like protein (isoleucine patch superfamily)